METLTVLRLLWIAGVAAVAVLAIGVALAARALRPRQSTAETAARPPAGEKAALRTERAGRTPARTSASAAR